MKNSGMNTENTVAFGKTLQALLLTAFSVSNLEPFLRQVLDTLSGPGGFGRGAGLAIVIDCRGGGLSAAFRNIPPAERRLMREARGVCPGKSKKGQVFVAPIVHGKTKAGYVLARAGKTGVDGEAARRLVETAAIIMKARLDNEERDAELNFERDLAAAVKHVEELYLAFPDISIEEISRAVLDEARRITGSSLGLAGCMDYPSGEFRVSAMTREAMSNPMAANQALSFKKSPGLLGWVLKRKKHMLTNNAPADRRAGGLPPGHLKIHKFLGVPAMSGRKLLGMLALANPDKPYGPEALDAAQKLARVYALMLRHKLAEQQKQADDAKYKSILDTSSDLIYNLTVDGKLTYVSRAIENYGYTQDEVTGRYFPGFIHPEDRERLKKVLSDAVTAGRSHLPLMTYRMQKKDGSFAVIEQKNSIIPRKGAAPIITGVMRDVTEQRQTEKLAQDLVEKNPLSIQIIDKDGFTLKINREHTRIFGAVPPPDYSIFKDPQLIKHGFVKLFKRVKKGEVVHLPYILFNTHDSDPAAPDKPLWLRSVIFPLFDGFGRPERFVLMHEDITRRKLAEDRQREEDARFKAIISASQDIIYTMGMDGKITYMSPRAADYGYKPKEMIGRPATDFAHPDDKDFIRKAFADTAATGRMLPVLPYRIKKSDGSYFYSEQKIGIVSCKGKPEYIAGIIRDVTYQRKTELLLKESEAVLRMIFDTAPDAIFIKDMNGIYLKANKACAALLGVAPEKLEGMSDWDFFPKEIAESINKSDSEAVRLKKTISQSNDHPFPSGKRCVNIIKTPLKNTRGEVVALLGIARDITDLKKMEKELVLAQAAQAISDVARPIAHDFNNALAAINGYATLIDDDLGDSSPIKTEITQIIKAVKRAAELTTQFQNFARDPKLGGKPGGSNGL